jgi:hypothetical protein
MNLAAMRVYAYSRAESTPTEGAPFERQGEEGGQIQHAKSTTRGTAPVRNRGGPICGDGTCDRNFQP